METQVLVVKTTAENRLSLPGSELVSNGADKIIADIRKHPAFPNALPDDSDAAILKICLLGSKIQKAVLSSMLTREVCVLFRSVNGSDLLSAELIPDKKLVEQYQSDVNAMNGVAMGEPDAVVSWYSVTLAFLRSQIIALCDFLGCEFRGGSESQNLAAYNLFQDYGGWSLPDFLLFFETAKKGRFKNQYQFIKNGLDYTILAEWAEKYADEREPAVLSLRSKTPNGDDLGGTSANIFEWFQRAEAARIEKEAVRRTLQADADRITAEWEQKIFENSPVPIYVKSIGGVETICEWSDDGARLFYSANIRTFRPGGVQRYAKRLIYEFVEFWDAKKTVETYNRLESEIHKKYINSGVSEYFEAEMKCHFVDFDRVVSEVSAEQMFGEILLKHEPTAKFYHILKASQAEISNVENRYWDDYLPEQIAKKLPSISKKMYVWQQACQAFVGAGFANPVASCFK